MGAIVLSEVVELGSPVAEVWPLLADTNRLNQAVGMPTMAFEPMHGGATGAARLVGEASILGIPARFEEFPFEWTAPKSFRQFRRALSGPVESVLTSFELEPVGRGADAGTKLTLGLRIEPRYGIFRPFAWLFARTVLGKMSEVARAIDGYVAEKSANPLDVVASQPNPELVAWGVLELKKRGVDDAVADALGAFIREAPDLDLAKIRPFDVAKDWGKEPDEVLRAMLHGVPAGLVELRWSIICPSCRVASEEVQALEDISLEGHCQLCDITFELDLDRSVEATFLPHPSARPIQAKNFCSGGPSRTPHVLVQATLADGKSKDLDAPGEPARYRLFARGGASASLTVEAGAPDRARLVVEAKGVKPADAKVAPDGIVEVKNASGEDRHVKLERLGYASNAATAHYVATMPEFRSLFATELLKPSTPLKVARAALFFSDLTGSTALYSKVGDAAAFRLVDDHFDVLREAIRAQQGTFVKTMGDAVMAAFHDTTACARAAVDALARFEAFKKGRPHGDLVDIKIGLNAGPCYVVTANGALDYFGQTVNVASRVQHLAESGQIVMGRPDFESLPVADRAKVRVVEEFTAKVKGVEEPLALVRLQAL